MPKQRPSTHTAAIRGAVYSSLLGRMATLEGEVFPFHVGDTWMEPARGCRMEDLTVSENPGMHRYSHPHGLPGLLDMLVDHTRSRTGVPVERSNLQITAGATAGLGLAVGAICDPGDEVLILAPYWPLIEGIVRTLRGTPVIVPIDDCATLERVDQVLARLDEAAGERTVALYHSFPNNPSGRTVEPEFIEKLTEWASSRQLFVISDEVYEKYAYRGTATNALALDPDHTFTVHSFSKSYGVAGNRSGYLVGPVELMPEVEKLATHTFYSAPTAGQLAAMRLLDRVGPDSGQAWVDNARRLYQEIGNQVADLLGVDPPDGGTFLFLDLSRTLEARTGDPKKGLIGFLEECADQGIFLAPGESFGPYPSYARFCFTAVAPDATLRGARLLADMLA